MGEFEGLPRRLFGVVVAFALILSPLDAQSSSTSANELFVKAVLLHREAADLPPAERDAKLHEVRDLFDRILAEHPDSDPADQIRTNPAPAGVQLADLPQSEQQVRPVDPATDTPLTDLESSAGHANSTAMIEAQTALGNSRSSAELEPAGKEPGEPLRRFQERYPEDFSALRRELVRGTTEEIAAAAMDAFAEHGLVETASALSTGDFWGLISFARAYNLDQIPTEVGIQVIAAEIAMRALDIYATQTGAVVDSARLVQLGSPPAHFITAAASGASAAGPAISAGVVAGFEAHYAARASYSEDKRFEEVSEHLVLADALRQIAADLERSELPGKAKRVRDRADEIIELAAQGARGVFKGSDGPVVAQMLREMDRVVQLLRAGEQQKAQDLFDEIHISAKDNAPGFFSLSTNNAYERYFMLGPQNRGDSLRAFDQLARVLHAVFDGQIATEQEETGEAAEPSQVALFEALPDGLYSTGAEVCSHRGENVVETLDRTFRLLDRPRLSMFDLTCDIEGASEANDVVEITASCNAEGITQERVFRWQISGSQSFTELGSLGEARKFQLCANIAPPGRARADDTTADASARDERQTGPRLLGPWAVQTEPDQALKIGEQGRGFAVSTNGAASFRGKPLFEDYRAPEPDYQRLSIFVDDAERRAVALFMRDGAERIALVDLEAGTILNDAPRPFWRYGPTDDVIWDPSGRYAALRMPMAEYSTGLGIFELETGRYATVPDRGFAANALDSWLADSLETRPDGTVAVKVATQKLNDYSTPMASDGTPPETRIIEIEAFFDGSGTTADSESASDESAGDPEARAVADQVWDPRIVISGETGIFDRTYGDLASPIDELRAAGAAEEAIAFSKAYAEDTGLGAPGEVVAVGFTELGAVDLISTSPAYTPNTSNPMLRNALAAQDGTIRALVLPVEMNRDLERYATDPTSRRVLGGQPDPWIVDYAVTGHRRLPNGGQRFVLQGPVSGSCRVCEWIGFAIAYVDVDERGAPLETDVVGIIPASALPDDDISAADIVSRPELQQYVLNMAGYDAGPMDGVTGTRTRQAIEAFQGDHCLTVSGTLTGPVARTLAQLDPLSPPDCAAGSSDARRADRSSAPQVDSSDAKETPVTAGESQPSYSVIVLDQPVSWHEARQVATRMGGDLAAPKSPEAQTEVWNTVRQHPESWVSNSAGYLLGPWLGGYQTGGAEEPDGGWTWVTGEQFSYTNWISYRQAGGQQPNDSLGVEDALVFMGRGSMSPLWNDYPSTPSGQGWQAEISAFVLERPGTGRPEDSPAVKSQNFLVDLPDLRAAPTQGEQTAIDATQAKLKEKYPDTYDAIFGDQLTSQVSREAKVEVAVLLIEVFDSPAVSEVLLQRLNLEFAQFLQLAVGRVSDDLVLPSGGLLGNIGASLAEEVAIDVAAGLATDVFFSLAPPVNARLEAPLRALLRSTIVELWGVKRGLTGDPGVILGKLVDRYYDILEIANASRILAATQDQALLATALSLETAAIVKATLPADTGVTIIAETRRNLGFSTDGAVGTDDAEAVERIFSVGLEALVAHHAGDAQTARKLRAEIARLGKAEGNITPFSAIIRPVDWLTNAANWGQDAPERAARILIGATALSEITAPPREAAPVDAGSGGESAVKTKQALEVIAMQPPQLGGLLKAHGVKVESELENASERTQAEAEIARYADLYRGNAPRVTSAELPFDVQSFDPETGTLRICGMGLMNLGGMELAAESVFGRSAPRIKFLPKDPWTAFGSLPALCTRGNGGAVQRIEAEYGTGEFQRFAVSRGGGLVLAFRTDPETAAFIQAASERGEARSVFECRMEYREHKPAQSSPYDHNAIGTCIIERVELRAYNREAGFVTAIVFDGEGQVMTPLGEARRMDLARPAVQASAGETSAIPRADWVFQTNATGETAIEDIVKGFAGGPVELILGYSNAFPFQTAPSKQLAVEVFGALPEAETGTVSGPERGYGSFILKNWSELNRFYFKDEPAEGLALASLGTIDDLRILSIQKRTGGSCEWSVNYRVWVTNKTPFGNALEQVSDTNGLTFSACFRTTRDGYEISEYRYVD